MASSNGNAADFAKRLEKRLADVNTRADSIQTMSQYAIQHKNEHAVVVQTWERVLKANADDQDKSIALFYVCNDILQNCRRKGADVYLKSFETSLPNSLPFFRNSAVEKVERVLKIWMERRVYPATTVETFLSRLNSSPKTSSSAVIETSNNRNLAPTPSGSSTTVTDAASAFSVSDIISRFKTDSLIEKLRHQSAIDSEISARNESMKNLDVDVSDIQVISHLKNKSEGKEFCNKFERSYTALQSFVGLLEKQTEARRKLVETLENAEVFYDTQYSEVKKISHVYNKYLNNVNQVMKKAAERRSTLPSPPPEEEEARTPSTIDGSDSMDLETGNEAASEAAATKFLHKSNSLTSNGGNRMMEPPGNFGGNFLPHPPLPLPPLPPAMMQMMPPPSSFNFVIPPHQAAMPPPPMPHFGSPRQQQPMSPRFGSPPPLMQQQPPPQMPPIPPNFAAYPTNQNHSPNKMGPPPSQFNFPPPPLPSANQSGSIPTLIGQRSMTAPNSPLQPVRPIVPLGPGGNFPVGKRKRSFEASGGGDDQIDPHYQRAAPPGEHLIPAQPVMSLPSNFESTRPISTIVGVRRSSSSAINLSNSDPRLGPGGPMGNRGRGRGMRGGFF